MPILFGEQAPEAGLSKIWKLIFIGFQFFGVRVINRGVAVSSTQRQQCTRYGVARVQAKEFTNSSVVNGRTDTTQDQTPLKRQLWTNKKVTDFGASTTTPAAFQSGQHNRWLAAIKHGEHADSVRRD